MLGGFAAGNLDGDRSATPPRSARLRARGPNSVVGGFAGVSVGDLVARDLVRRGERNVGQLSRRPRRRQRRLDHRTRPSTSTVTGSGANNFAGGLVGVNFGWSIRRSRPADVASGREQHRRHPHRRQRRAAVPGRHCRSSARTRRIRSAPAPPAADRAARSEGRSARPIRSAGLPDLPARPCDGQAARLCGGTLFNPNGDPVNPDISAPAGSQHHRQQHDLDRADFAADERDRGHQYRHRAQELRSRHQQPERRQQLRFGRQLARRAEGRRSGWRCAPARQRGRGLRARPAAERHAAAQRDALPQRRGRVPARRPALRPGAREPPEPARAAGAVPGRHRPARPQGSASQAARRRDRAQHHRGAREEGREFRGAAGLPVRARRRTSRRRPRRPTPTAGATRRSTSSTSSACPKRI